MGSATCIRGAQGWLKHAWLGDSGHSARSASARGAEIDLHSVTLPCRLCAMRAREWPCATLPRISDASAAAMRFLRAFSPRYPMRTYGGHTVGQRHACIPRSHPSPNSAVARHNINTHTLACMEKFSLPLARAPPHCSLTFGSASLCSFANGRMCVILAPR